MGGRGKQFKKDKLYITPTEYANAFGGKKDKVESKPYLTLQFFCCNLSLQPWIDPVCTPEGAIFDLVNIIPFLKKHKVNPVTGQPMRASSLVPLHFYKNADGVWHCPISNIVFTDHTHIVAIKTTGNVYAFKSVDKLNIQKKNWIDLVTGEAFTRQDIITIQDPQNPVDPSGFYFVKKGLTGMNKAEVSSDPLKNIVLSSTSERIFQEIQQKDAIAKEKKDREFEEEMKKQANSSAKIQVKEKPRYRGSDAASLTSTAFTPKLEVDSGWQPKKTTLKGYVRLVTNKGNLNLQLHCDLAPLACENFLTHCENDYYKYTKFHRNIKNFMIQGGDPTGTGAGGESIWGRQFPNECVPSLKHDSEGVLALANKGKDTNGSQFYITYKSCPHLNDKHTVFGKLVGGSDVLKELANIQTDEDDTPIEDIVILQTIVYKNPFSSAEMEAAAQTARDKEKKDAEDKEYGQWLSNVPKPSLPKANEAVPKGAIGRYIDTTKLASKPLKRPLDFGAPVEENKHKKPKTGGGYGDFSAF